jgi:hypothetical protein
VIGSRSERAITIRKRRVSSRVLKSTPVRCFICSPVPVSMEDWLTETCGADPRKSLFPTDDSSGSKPSQIASFLNRPFTDRTVSYPRLTVLRRFSHIRAKANHTTNWRVSNEARAAIPGSRGDAKKSLAHSARPRNRTRHQLRSSRSHSPMRRSWSAKNIEAPAPKSTTAHGKTLPSPRPQPTRTLNHRYLIPFRLNQAHAGARPNDRRVR